MSKNWEDLYNDLINEETLNKFQGSDRSQVDDEDMEDIMTSKELVKEQKRIEERFGPTPHRPIEIEEELYTSYAKKRTHKYTESELAQIRESCERTIVHDYGERDIYHMSDEERAENDMLAEISLKLGLLKHTYGQVDQFVEAMRIVVTAWEILEEKGNFIHTKEEFFEMVGEGKITTGRFIMPKLRRMNDYNIDVLVKYISNPELDPKDLIPVKDEDPKDDFYREIQMEESEEYQQYCDEYVKEHENDTDEDGNKISEYKLLMDADEYAKDRIREDETERLLSPEEAEYILRNEDDPPEIKVRELPRKYIKGYDDKRLSTRKSKKLGKKKRMIVRDVHDLLNKIQDNPANRTDGSDENRSYLITNSMFDTDKPKKDFWDELYFNGSWASKYDTYLYDLITREELLKLHPPKNKYLTYADQMLNQFFTIAEKNGINTIELRRLMELSESGKATSSVEVKAKEKENKRIENAIINRITSLNNDPKFKKLVSKAESALDKYYDKE